MASECWRRCAKVVVFSQNVYGFGVGQSQRHELLQAIHKTSLKIGTAIISIGRCLYQ